MMRQHQANEVFVNIIGRHHRKHLLVHVIHCLTELIAAGRFCLTSGLSFDYGIHGVATCERRCQCYSNDNSRYDSRIPHVHLTFFSSSGARSYRVRSGLSPDSLPRIDFGAATRLEVGGEAQVPPLPGSFSPRYVGLLGNLDGVAAEQLLQLLIEARNVAVLV
jgi:hypothetical protein